MTLLTCWLVFPLVVALLALGCGLLLETAAGVRMQGALIVPAGLAVVTLVGQFATLSDATAELAAPAVISLAIAGIALSPRPRKRQLDAWAVGCAVAVFAVFAAPVVLSGHATFAGYIKLDDTSTWLALTDRVMEHGRSVAGLAPSSYEATLDINLAHGYPTGAFLPLGIARDLVGRDAAWLFQPYLALLASMLALTLYALVTKVIESRPARALAVFVAAQPALLFGYALWGGIKELAGAWILALVAALATPVLKGGSLAHALPLAVASSAALGILSLGGALWLAPALILTLVAAIGLLGKSGAFRQAVGFCGLAALLALPSFLTVKFFLQASAAGELAAGSTLGNLIRPLSPLQLFGVWPNGDFRVSPRELDATHVLVALVAVMALVGLAVAWKRRAWELLIYVTGAAAGCLLLGVVGSPWIDGKALAMASPALVLAALVGAVAVSRSGRQVEAAVLAAAIAGGVVWSNALAYHDVSLAPRERLAELEHVGKLIAGQGPTLMTDYEPHGVRHFLRDADPEGASELRRRQVTLRGGGTLGKGEFADLDRFVLEAVTTYRTLVLRRSPVGSRSPAGYRLTYRGRFYEVWQRPERSASPIVEHLPLGTGAQAGAVPDCGQVMRLARLAGSRGSLAFVRREPAFVVDLSKTSHPSSWGLAQGGLLLPAGPGTIRSDIRVSSPGRYGFWVGGSVRGRLELVVDGSVAGAVRQQLNNLGQYMLIGVAPLSRGLHRVELRYEGSDWRPGSGGRTFPLGPLVLARGTADRPVQYVRSADARRLCGQRLDWVEALTRR